MWPHYPLANVVQPERYSVRFFTLENGLPVLLKTCTRCSLHTVIRMMDNYVGETKLGKVIYGAAVYDWSTFVQGKGEYEQNH